MVLLMVPVHPHACGEHGRWRGARPPNFGSSPRMWGTPGRVPARPLRARFIPTHVGNTRWLRWLQHPSPVHPHACGEHGNEGCEVGGVAGSFPRMWGTLMEYVLNNREDRFIPTH